jgi:hypothetical protein
MHVRVLWKPRRGIRDNLPSESNASIRWYVLGDRGNGQTESLEYSGTGVVRVNRSGKTARFDIRSGQLKPSDSNAARGGTLADPVGRARIGGTVTARVNSQRVSDLLAEVRSSLQGETRQAAGF